MGEQRTLNSPVVGSSPTISTKFWGISDNGSTSALHAESESSILSFSTNFILWVGKWYVVWFGTRKSSVRFTLQRPNNSAWEVRYLTGLISQ